MGILDDLGGKLSKTSQNIVSKANELLDSSKIKSQMAQEEKLIKSFYAELGELYYNANGEAPDAQFSELCVNISEANKRMALLKKQLAFAKNVKICENCGTECKSTLAFCGNCGTELPKVSIEEFQQINEKVCSNCGNILSEQSLFCSACGTKYVGE